MECSLNSTSLRIVSLELLLFIYLFFLSAFSALGVDKLLFIWFVFSLSEKR